MKREKLDGRPALNPILAKTAIISLVAAGCWLAVQWWPGERPANAVQGFMHEWKSGSYKDIADKIHKDELTLMSATKEQVAKFLSDLRLSDELEFREIASGSRAQGGMKAKLRDSAGKRRTLDLLPDGRSWRYGLGSMIISSCQAQDDTAGCILNVADSMQRNGIKRLVIAENWVQSEPQQLRRFARNPEFAFSPLDRSMEEE